MPLLTRLQQVEKSTGKRPKALDVDEIPSGLVHVWNWFCELNKARTTSEFGPNPLTYQELLAWATITETTIRPHEVHLLRELDSMWLRCRGEP